MWKVAKSILDIEGPCNDNVECTWVEHFMFPIDIPIESLYMLLFKNSCPNPIKPIRFMLYHTK